MKDVKKTTIETTINYSIEKVWEFFTLPKHITQWNFAADSWHSPKAINDLTVGGKFNYRMEAKDGSFGFDFEGIYDTIKINELIEYTLGDGRKVSIEFAGNGKETKVIESFEPENENPIELQKGGWQAILDNFKKHVETN